MLGYKSASIISRWEQGVLLPETLNVLKIAILYETAVESIFAELYTEIAHRMNREAIK